MCLVPKPKTVVIASSYSRWCVGLEFRKTTLKLWFLFSSSRVNNSWIARRILESRIWFIYFYACAVTYVPTNGWEEKTWISYIVLNRAIILNDSKHRPTRWGGVRVGSWREMSLQNQSQKNFQSIDNLIRISQIEECSISNDMIDMYHWNVPL